MAPTVAVLGLAFFSYGFPQAGSCIEISIPLIVLVLLFTLVINFLMSCVTNISQQLYETPCKICMSIALLEKYVLNILLIKRLFLSLQYMRRISLFGNRIFLVYAVIFSSLFYSLYKTGSPYPYQIIVHLGFSLPML